MKAYALRNQWRETRTIVFSYLLAITWVCWDVMRHAPVSLGALRIGIDGWRDFSLLWAGLAFASLLLGGAALQRETAIKESTAELSPSRRRSSSVGSHSIVGLAEIIALTLVTMGVFVTMYHFGLIRFGPPVVASVERPIQMPLSFLRVQHGSFRWTGLQHIMLGYDPGSARKPRHLSGRDCFHPLHLLAAGDAIFAWSLPSESAELAVEPI